MKGQTSCQQCSLITHETQQHLSSTPILPCGNKQEAEARRLRAETRLRTEAKTSRLRLGALLAELREPLAGSHLLFCVTGASRLCSGVFEKAYLTKLAARLIGIPSQEVELLGIGAELAMFSALTVDDWIDHTPFRAGRPTLHATHGPAMTVFAASCLAEAAHEAVRQACRHLPQEHRTEIEKAFTRSFLSIQAGQAMVERSDAGTASPAFLDRLARVRCGRLIGFAMGSVGWFSGNSNAARSLEEAGTWIGTALQHRNDIQDFTVSFDQDIKPPLADLLNGQPNLVISHIVRHADRLSDSEQTLLTQLKGRNKLVNNKPVTLDEFNAVLHMVAQTEAGTLAGRQLSRCLKKADNALARYFDNKLLDEWKDYTLLLQHP